MPKLVHMENEGTLYRGFAMGHPSERWSEKERVWKPYEGGHKPIEWGSPVSHEEAAEWTALKEMRRFA